MKKIISALLSVLMLFCCFAVTSSAVSEKQGMDALRAQFQKGQSELDYVYYSPAGKNDDKKYETYNRSIPCIGLIVYGLCIRICSGNKHGTK